MLVSSVLLDINQSQRISHSDLNSDKLVTIRFHSFKLKSRVSLMKGKRRLLESHVRKMKERLYFPKERKGYKSDTTFISIVSIIMYG